MYVESSSTERPDRRARLSDSGFLRLGGAWARHDDPEKDGCDSPDGSRPHAAKVHALTIAT